MDEGAGVETLDGAAFVQSAFGLYVSGVCGFWRQEQSNFTETPVDLDAGYEALAVSFMDVIVAEHA